MQPLMSALQRAYGAEGLDVADGGAARWTASKVSPASAASRWR